MSGNAAFTAWTTLKVEASARLVTSRYTERLGGQRNSRPGAQEHPLPRQKLEITEAIFLDRFVRHLRNSLKTGTFRKIQNSLRTSHTFQGNKSVYVNPIFIGLEGDR